LTYINCGHPPQLLLRADGKVVRLEQHNIALGILQNFHYKDSIIPMMEGDVLVLYTDGVIELMNQQGEAFGIQRLGQVIQEHRQLPAVDLINKVIEAARVFSADEGFLDDLTLVIVRRGSS
jgi:sigma-B regulation protein RsbU (phosphoserine phosphatase)